MANWEYAIITAKGKSLQAKLIAGTTLSITRVVSGAGYVSPVLLDRQTEVTDPKQTLAVKGVTYPDEGKCALRTYLTNEGLTTEYMARQIGVYATDPDEGEILYFISQVGNQDQGSFVPAESSLTASFSAEWTFYFQYGQADEVSVIVDPALAVSHEELGEALETKADLVDGKVPVTQIPDLEYVPKYNADTAYPADSYCIHKGAIWRNTSGGTVAGVEPGTDYNKWNVTYSNGNLFDNPWFNVVQAGYGGLHGAIQYAADRWIADHDGGTVAGEGTGAGGIITINRDGNHSGISQALLRRRLEKGKTYTFSINTGLSLGDSQKPQDFALFDSEYRLLYAYAFPEDAQSGDIAAVTFTATEEISGNAKFAYAYFRTGITKVYAVKLEPGPFSTLANDTAPDLQMETIKCSLSTADPTDDYANGRRTAQLVGSVNRNGDTISGSVFQTWDGVGFALAGGNVYGAFLEASQQDHSVRRHLAVRNIEFLSDDNDALVLWNSLTNDSHAVVHTGRVVALEAYNDAMTLRNQRLLSYDANPEVNGEISWTYG